MSDRVEMSYEYWRDSALRFDYFLLAVIGGLVAYSAQAYVPTQLGCNAKTLELVSILVLIGSGAAGVQRLESVTECFGAMMNRVRAENELSQLRLATAAGGVKESSTGKSLTADEILREAGRLESEVRNWQGRFGKYSSKAERMYRYRNRLLLLGLLLLLTARVLVAYEL